MCTKIRNTIKSKYIENCESVYLVLSRSTLVNPLMGTLKSQSNGPLYSTVVHGWAMAVGTARRGTYTRIHVYVSVVHVLKSK